MTHASLSRRTLLAALPATGAMFVLPALGIAETRSIGDLFAQWWDLRCQINTISGEIPETLCDAWSALEGRILALPTKTPADLARKLFVVTDGDPFGGNYGCDSLDAELEALAMEGLS